MIQIHATKKLLAKMPDQMTAGSEDVLAVPQSKLGSWHANLLPKLLSGQISVADAEQQVDAVR